MHNLNYMSVFDAYLEAKKVKTLTYQHRDWRDQLMNHSILGEENDVGLVTSELFIRGVDTIKQRLREGYYVQLAVSFGKDSSVLVVMAINAILELKRDDEKVEGKVILTHSSTKIDIPEVDQLAKRHWNSLMVFCCLNGLEGEYIDFVLARPSFTSSWIGKVVSGRALPTTVNSGVRACTTDLKIRPMEKALNTYLRSKGVKSAQDKQEKVLLLLGSRDDEGTIRANSIRKFGGQNDPLAVCVSPESKQKVSYIIKDFSTETIWLILSFSGLDDRKVIPSFIPNYDDIIKTYADSSGECVLVSTSETEMKNSKPCSSRHGCFSCLPSGSKDKSMENLLKQPEYGYLKQLSRIRQWLFNTHNDWNDRTMAGRTIDNRGYLRIQPDLYSFSKCKRLLHALLTADAIECERAELHAERYYSGELEFTESNRSLCHTQFKMVSFEDVVLLDFLWGMHMYSDEPYAAMKLWYRVWEERDYDMLSDTVELEYIKPTSQPKPYYLYVGKDWDSTTDVRLEGFYDPLFADYSSGCDDSLVETRKRKLKTTGDEELYDSLAFIEANELSVSGEALIMMERDIEYYVSKQGELPSASAMRMVREGAIIIGAGKQSTYFNMMKRAQFFQFSGLNKLKTLEEVKSKFTLLDAKQHALEVRFSKATDLIEVDETQQKESSEQLDFLLDCDLTNHYASVSKSLVKCKSVETAGNDSIESPNVIEQMSFF